MSLRALICGPFTPLKQLDSAAKCRSSPDGDMNKLGFPFTGGGFRGWDRKSNPQKPGNSDRPALFQPRLSPKAPDAYQIIS